MRCVEQTKDRQLNDGGNFYPHIRNRCA